MAKRLNTETLCNLVLKEVHEVRAVSEDWTAEAELCDPGRGMAGFQRFCAKHVYVLDSSTKRIVQFEWYQGQAVVAPYLVNGDWLVLLKGRQLGITLLCVAYCLWRLTFHTYMTIVIINQEKSYAQDFIEKVRMMWSFLPPALQKRITTDNSHEVEFKDGGNLGHIRAIAPKKHGGAARSITGDIVIIDEAGFVPWLDKTMQGIQPIVEVSDGQIVNLSTSAGPSGFFYECWVEAYGQSGERAPSRANQEPTSRFIPVFLHWSMRPGRDAAWYDETERELTRTNPVGMKQEHPNNPQEAFEYAAGRIYSLFQRDYHVATIEIPTGAKRFRAIDWGETESPFVCLWIAYIAGESALFVDPACTETIREMFAYRYDPENPEEILKEDDHTCDALRYAVTEFKMWRGTVFVYRELYIRRPIDMHTVRTLAERIHEISGWSQKYVGGKHAWRVDRDGEVYDGGVADRAGGPLIKEMRSEHGIRPLAGHRKFKFKTAGQGKEGFEPVKGEVKNGIRLVRLLVHGTMMLEERLAKQVRVVRRPPPPKTARTLVDSVRGVDADQVRRLLIASKRLQSRDN